jgi:hypothetical protein
MFKRSRSLQASVIGLGLAISVGLSCGSASGQVVWFVSGKVIEPRSGLTTGQKLNLGDVATTGQDGLIVLEYKWESDRPAYPCVGFVVIGRRQSYRVSPEGQDGTCRSEDPEAVLTRHENGESFVGRAVFYGEPKYDDPNTPASVRQSQEKRGQFRQRLTTPRSP